MGNLNSTVTGRKESTFRPRIYHHTSAGSDPILRALHQANAPLLVMDADPDEGFIRGKMKGGPLPRGRGLLMAEDTGVFVQVAATELRK